MKNRTTRQTTFYNPDKGSLHGVNGFDCELDGLSKNCVRHNAGVRGFTFIELICFIALFSLITMLYNNVSSLILDSVKMHANNELALNLAKNIIETYKNEDFKNLKICKDKKNDFGKERSFDVVRSISYFGKNLTLKLVTVNVSFKFKGSAKNIELSTIIRKKNVQ